MLDSLSGTLRLDSGETLFSGMQESDFLQMTIGAAARKGLTSGDYHWYALTAALMGRTWNMSLGFESAALRHVSFSPARSNASWGTFSTDEEMRVAVELQEMLRSWLPGIQTEIRPQMQCYSFSWGSVAAGVVPQDATASVSILYKNDHDSAVRSQPE